MRMPNPFESRFIKPGASEFVPHEGINPDSIRKKFLQMGSIAAVVGPHGSGKTTLARHLSCVWGESHSVEWIGLEPRGRRVRAGDAGPPETLTADAALCVVDGFQQLSAWSRWRMVRRIRLGGRGLLVTTHRALRGIPTLIQMQPSPEHFWRIVEGLQQGRGLITREQAMNSFEQCGRNVRESLFQLYDIARDRMKGAEEDQGRLRGLA